jgi:hypothetical protein
LPYLVIRTEVGASLDSIHDIMRPIRRHVPTPATLAFAAIAIAIAGLTPVTGSAQVEGFLPKSTFMSVSTRAMALGDSYMMNSGHADALFYHPALLTNASGFGIDVQRWSASATAAAISGATTFLGGGIAVGLRTLQYGAPGTGALAAPAGQDHLFADGPVGVSERVATIGYAREVFLGIDLGVAVDLVDQRVGVNRGGVTLFDLSAARDVGPVVLGLTVQDWGEKPIVGTDRKPQRVTLGAGAYGQQLGIFDLGFAAHVGANDDEFTYGGGLEIGYWPIQGRTFVARVGFADVPDGSDASPVTTGFAFWADDFTIEWAFRPFSGADEGGTHRFGVRWR